MIARIFVLLMIASHVSKPAFAQNKDGQRIVGDWLVTSQEDRFEEGGTYIAMAGDGGGHLLGVRCIQKKLSLAFMNVGSDPKPLRIGDIFAFKIRTDKKPVFETMGKAINDRLIELVTTKEVVRDMRAGSETALRIESVAGVSNTTVFKTRGAKQAFAVIEKDCPLE